MRSPSGLAFPISWVLVIAACGEPGDPRAQVGVSKVAGDTQAVVTGYPVAVPPSVRVADANGDGIAGMAVTFSPSSGGSVVGAAQLTNADGVATVGEWKPGTTLGAKTLNVSVGSSATVSAVFGADVVAQPASIRMNYGDGETKYAGEWGVMVGVGVLGSDGLGAGGVPVTFTVTSGGGSLAYRKPVSSFTMRTSPFGAGYVTWRLGCAPGPQTLRAEVSGLAPITFTATALQPESYFTTVLPSSFAIAVGDTVYLHARGADRTSDATCGNVHWGPSSSTSATVTAEGFLTARLPGAFIVPVRADIGSSKVTGTVYVTGGPDSVAFVYSENGVPRGWTGSTLSTVVAKFETNEACVELYAFKASVVEPAVHWQATIAGSGLVPRTVEEQPTQRCFIATQAGTVTVTGSFAGRTAKKVVTIH